MTDGDISTNDEAMSLAGVLPVTQPATDNPKAPLTELIEMLSAVSSEEDCAIFEHSPEEIGIVVMECHADVLAALRAAPAPQPAMAGERQLAKLVRRIDAALSNIVEGLEDEGDRVYLESTNDVETMRALIKDTEAAVYQIMEAERA
jgi:hypothetical protein